MSKTEVVEIEYSDDDILYYIDDEQGNEIGFAVLEDGKEVEYYYVDSLGDKVGQAVGTVVDGVVGGVKEALDDNPFVSAEGVSHLRDDLNVIYKENADTMNSLRSIAQDMRDFKDLFTGKPLKPRSEEKKSTAASDDMGGTEAGMEMFAKESLQAESEPALKPAPKSESKTEPKFEAESASSGVARPKADTKPILDADMRAELMAELREELKEEMRAELRASNAAAVAVASAGEPVPSPAATAPSAD